MTREELIAAIRQANINDRWAALVDSVRTADDPAHFATIFAHAVEPQSIGAAVYDAARLLYESNLTCRMPCENAILAMLISWDVSIEEVPWYLTNQVGSERMRQCVEDSIAGQHDESVRATLKTVRYWVDLNPTTA